jgi:hypothetical protein
MAINYAKLLRQGYEWIVVAAYDGPYGPKGALISRHRTYEAAERSARRRAPGEARNWLALRDTRSYA